jgi:hypothetical protein
MTNPITTIRETFNAGSYADLEAIYATKRGTKYRIRLHSDSSYHNQSSAVAEVWSAEGWRMVTRPVPESMKAVWEAASPYGQQATAARRREVLQKAAMDLLRVAMEVAEPV